MNYYCPQWAPSGELFVVCDKTNFWNVYHVDLQNNDEEGFGRSFAFAHQKCLHYMRIVFLTIHFLAIIKNIFPIDAEIGYPMWQFGDQPFATNGRCYFVMCYFQLKFSDIDP